MNPEQRQLQHKKEREREHNQEKHHEQEIEDQEKKEGSPPRPFGLILVGFTLTLIIVLSWIFFV